MMAYCEETAIGQLNNPKKQVEQNRSGNFEQLTGQKTLVTAKNSNVFSVATKEQAQKDGRSSAPTLRSGDIFEAALQRVTGSALARR